MEGVSWQVVAILCTVIVTLLGSVMSLILSRFNAQSKKTVDLTKLVHNVNGAHRERMAQIEARIETVRETLLVKITDSVEYYRHNVPELHEENAKIRKDMNDEVTKLRSEFSSHCIAEAKGAKA